MSSSSTVTKSRIIVCSRPEALTNGTIRHSDNKRWSSTRDMVRKDSGEKTDRSFTCALPQRSDGSMRGFLNECLKHVCKEKPLQ